jgi:hypothetical protein
MDAQAKKRLAVLGTQLPSMDHEGTIDIRTLWTVLQGTPEFSTSDLSQHKIINDQVMTPDFIDRQRANPNANQATFEIQCNQTLASLPNSYLEISFFNSLASPSKFGAGFMEEPDVSIAAKYLPQTLDTLTCHFRPSTSSYHIQAHNSKNSNFNSFMSDEGIQLWRGNALGIGIDKKGLLFFSRNSKRWTPETIQRQPEFWRDCSITIAIRGDGMSKQLYGVFFETCDKQISPQDLILLGCGVRINMLAKPPTRGPTALPWDPALSWPFGEIQFQNLVFDQEACDLLKLTSEILQILTR